MALEIERKFLVKGDGWRKGAPTLFRQGYLNLDKNRTVRIRIFGDKAVLTVKGPTEGLTRSEFEYEVPVDDAAEMLKLCEGGVIEKNRWLFPHGEHVWEIDEFLGENKGLVVAEIELTSEGETFEKPDWVGEEVSHDPRYFNSYLSEAPYTQW